MLLEWGEDWSLLSEKWECHGLIFTKIFLENIHSTKWKEYTTKCFNISISLILHCNLFLLSLNKASPPFPLIMQSFSFYLILLHTKVMQVRPDLLYKCVCIGVKIYKHFFPCSVICNSRIILMLLREYISLGSCHAL